MKSTVREWPDQGKFQDYLTHQQNNRPEDIAKAISIIENKPELFVEGGFGDGRVAVQKAKSNPNVGFIIFDSSPSLVPYRELRDQAPENLAVLNADMNLFKYFPNHSIKYLMLLNPYIRMIEELLLQRITVVDQKTTLDGYVIIRPKDDDLDYKPYIKYNQIFKFQRMRIDSDWVMSSIFDVRGASHDESARNMRMFYLGFKIAYAKQGLTDQSGAKNSAMTVRNRGIEANSKTGGIDLTPGNLNLQTKVIDPRLPSLGGGFRGNDGGIKFYLDPAMLAQLQNAPGFVPVIINIQRVTDLRSFLDSR